MKIYTYYQDINFVSVHGDQQELIDLWKISWSRQGYEPIVLNLEDAKKHSFFETLNSEMRRIFKEITNKEIDDYGMNCWFRWLAYATQKDEKFYVSDYDAINVNFPITEASNQLHFMGGACPFLASGTPKQFENLCNKFIEVTKERMEILKQQANHYHDQEFLLYNFCPNWNDSCYQLRNQHDILMTRDESKFGGIDINTDSLVYHVSHHLTQVTLETEYYKSYKTKYKQRARAMLIRDLLKIEKPK